MVKNTDNNKLYLLSKQQLLSYDSLNTVQSSKVTMIIQDLVHMLWRLATTKYILKMLSVYILSSLNLSKSMIQIQVS